MVGYTPAEEVPVLHGARARIAHVVGQGGLLDLSLVLLDLERAREVEDGSLGLTGHDPARHERPPVTDPVHLVADGLVAGTPPDEVGVEGVDVVVIVHGGLGGPEALGYHLAAVHPAPRILGADPHIDVGAVRFECHQGTEISDFESHVLVSCSAVECHGYVECDPLD